MTYLDDDLRAEGMEPTEGECPECENGQLWNGSAELVCDECAVVVEKSDTESVEHEYGSWFEYFQANRDDYVYDSSEKKKCLGAFLGNYEWGDDDGLFTY